MLDCAILKDGVSLASICRDAGREHSVTALPAIIELFEQTNLTPQDIDVFVVAVGPGSYTGTRIGASIIQAMAHAVGKDALGINTLELMARAYDGKNPIISPVIDARRGAVFNAIYEKKGDELIELVPPRRIERTEIEYKDAEVIEKCQNKWERWACNQDNLAPLKLVYLGGSV
jgi:tRNA threonylcarbamoyladenosine biosynthesis protein TsaB